MGEIIDVLNEVRLRMKAGIDANKIDHSHSDIYVGSKSAFLKMNDYPLLGILLSSGDGTAQCMRYGQTEKVSIQIGYMIPVLQDDYNTLYKPSDSTGPLRNLEQIINYLQLNRTTAAPDLQLAGTAYDALKYRWNIQELTEDNLFFFTVTIDVNCAKYTRGAL